jgi:hypothetical protein
VSVTTITPRKIGIVKEMMTETSPEPSWLSAATCGARTSRACARLAWTAYEALHVRRSWPYTDPCLLPLHLFQEVDQSEEILRPETASSSRDLLERIHRCRARPLDGQVPKLAGIVAVEDPILAPRLLVRHELNLAPSQGMKRMGHPNGFTRTVPIRCSRRPTPTLSRSALCFRSRASALNDSFRSERAICDWPSRNTCDTTISNGTIRDWRTH